MVTWIGSPNFTAQSGIAKRHITLHWMVGTLRSTDAVFTRKGSGVSAQYGIEGDTIHQYVAEKDYAWADGNTFSNRYGISIEHAGGWLLPDGSRKDPSLETHETSAQLCAEIARRHDLGRLVVGENIFPHNHWVATMCPGTLDVRWIAARANEINYPTPKKRKKNMTTRFVKIGTGGANFGAGAVVALAGDVGYPCPGNFDEYTRPTLVTGERDRASYEFDVHGPAIPIPAAEWAALKKRYTEGGGGGTPGTFTAADRARLEAVPTAAQNADATRARIVAKE